MSRNECKSSSNVASITVLFKVLYYKIKNVFLTINFLLVFLQGCFNLYTVLRMSTYLYFHEYVGIHINVLNGFKKAMVIFSYSIQPKE